MTSTQALASHLKNFTNKTILVVGDIMFDVFVRGEVNRISPEAPVPVVFQTSRSAHLGGAGNTAANVSALGAKTLLLGVIGGDAEGRELKRLARAAKIKSYFAVDPKRLTTVKTRVAARHHQFVRIDRESDAPLGASTERQLLSLIKELPRPDWIIISDYAKGVVSKEVVASLKRRFGAGRILADFKPADAVLFKRVAVITPNINEAWQLSGIHATTDAKAAEAVRFLAKRFGTSVILTRGEHGMTTYQSGNGKPVHVASEAREIFDVTGAGDTVIAVAALMLSCGSSIHDAARAANFVAGIVVGREGTAVISAKELEPLLASS